MTPRFIAPLDPGFLPFVFGRREYRQAVEASGRVANCALVIVRHDSLRSRFDFQVIEPNDGNIGKTYQYVERMLKFLLWSRGGWKIVFAGPAEIGRRIEEDYCSTGRRAFDIELMSNAYRRSFEVTLVHLADVPEAREAPLSIGGVPDGCRIGIDLGASDYKISAVVDGDIVYSDEIPWNPKPQSDPQYHVNAIRNGIDICASKMERVDAIGVSSAGVYVDDEPRVASLFRSVSEDDFDRVIRPLFKSLAREYDVPLIAINDGEVSAILVEKAGSRHGLTSWHFVLSIFRKTPARTSGRKTSASVQCIFRNRRSIALHLGRGWILAMFQPCPIVSCTCRSL